MEFDVKKTIQEVLSYQQGFKDGVNQTRKLIDEALEHMTTYVNKDYPPKVIDANGQDIVNPHNKE